MYKIIKNRVLVAVIFLISFINNSYSQKKLDSIFVNWNQLTFMSLERQEMLAKEDNKKLLYKNRYDAFLAFLEIDSVTSLNKKSIRYAFLKKILNRINSISKVNYIIEADKSGYITVLRNIVIYKSLSDDVSYDIYICDDGRWRIERKGKINCKLNKSNLKDFITNFGRGFNVNDDVIITSFEGNHIKESEFFLLSTLSDENCFKHII